MKNQFHYIFGQKKKWIFSKFREVTFIQSRRLKSMRVFLKKISNRAALKGMRSVKNFFSKKGSIFNLWGTFKKSCNYLYPAFCVISRIFLLFIHFVWIHEYFFCTIFPFLEHCDVAIHGRRQHKTRQLFVRGCAACKSSVVRRPWEEKK